MEFNVLTPDAVAALKPQAKQKYEKDLAIYNAYIAENGGSQAPSKSKYAVRKEHETKITRVVRFVDNGVDDPFYVVKTEDLVEDAFINQSKCAGKTPKRGDLLFYQNMKAGDVVKQSATEDYTYPEDKLRVTGFDVPSEEDIRVSVTVRLKKLTGNVDM